jgi:phenylpropionate dioxygenase-like ring-hydroxylating dioxygenase large terminal subunit
VDKATLTTIVREVEGYIATDGTKLAASDQFHSADIYASPERLAAERALLRRYPVIVGHGSKITKPGDFFTDDSTGLPLIITRQDDGTLRALVNVCRHRGARVCPDSAGHRKHFTCPYHAWTYRSDGGLRTVPRAEAFPSIDPKTTGLQTVPVEERHGFIWVVATPGASIDIAAYLGPLDAELAAYGAADMVLERETVLTEQMNWKFVVDGFFEVYHFPSLHSKTIAPYFHGKHSPFESYGLHGRMVGVRKSFDGIRGAWEELDRAELIKHFAMNYYLFPNTVLVWQADHFECWTATPGARADECHAHVQSIATVAAATEARREKWDKNWKILIGTVVAEDWAVSKTIQSSVHAAAGGQIVFGRNEPGLQHFHSELQRVIAADASPRVGGA